MIRIAISEKAYTALVACVDEKPKAKPEPNPKGEVVVGLDEMTVARLKKIAELYARDISRTILRLAELLDEWSVSMLQELMNDNDDLMNDPWYWNLAVQGAEGRERDFRAFIAKTLSNAPWLYKELDLNPALDLNAVIDQALVKPGRDHWEQRRRKSELIKKGYARPKRRR
jgi:hypothetical protein